MYNCIVTSQVSQYEDSSVGWRDVSPRLCGRELPPKVTTTAEKTRITFWSNAAVNGDGFKVR